MSQMEKPIYEIIIFRIWLERRPKVCPFLLQSWVLARYSPISKKEVI